MTETIVRNKVDLSSLWNVIIIEVVGSPSVGYSTEEQLPSLVSGMFLFIGMSSDTSWLNAAVL